MADAAGIDVSGYQGTFNWQAEKGAISFAFMKATEGATLVDPDFARNWQQSKAAGLIRGAYHFAHPKDGAAANSKAFLDAVRKEGLGPGDLIALDLETSDGMSAAKVAECARTWCSDVKKATGITPIVYTYVDFARAGNCAGLGGYPLWIADPASPASRPTVPAPWAKWTIHQYSSAVTDKDVFNGDEAALTSFVNDVARATAKEPEVQSGMLLNGASAITAISVPAGSAKEIGFGCDNSLQGLPPATLRVAIWGGSWAIHTGVKVDSTKGQTVISFAKPADTTVISVARSDAGTVNVGYQIS